MSRDFDALDKLLHAELHQPVMAEAQFMATQIVAQIGPQVSAILFYGSCLRTNDGAGLMDFYVLTKDADGYGEAGLARRAHILVPPHVRYVKTLYENNPVHAKVSIITLSRFAALCQPKANDISIWARFAQPSALVFARDPAIEDQVQAALRRAVKTAIAWAVHFGPEAGGQAGDFWRALFRATYGAELRIEDQSRADQIIALAAKRYDDLFLPALIAAGFSPTKDKDQQLVIGQPIEGRRHTSKGKWLRCQIASKFVNLARILKGAVTFEGRADYVSWKIERRTGVKLVLTPWQRNHPLLAMPQILAQLWRAGAFRKSR